jgi:hypothetical protein
MTIDFFSKLEKSKTPETGWVELTTFKSYPRRISKKDAFEMTTNSYVYQFFKFFSSSL